MSTARHIVALLRSHIDGDEERFLSVATQLAAHEARQGHGKLAQELRELIDAAKGKGATVARRGAGPVPLAQPKGELSSLLAARYADIRLSSMVLAPELEDRLARVVTEQRQQARLRERGLCMQSHVGWGGGEGTIQNGGLRDAEWAFRHSLGFVPH